MKNVIYFAFAAALFGCREVKYSNNFPAGSNDSLEEVLIDAAAANDVDLVKKTLSIEKFVMSQELGGRALWAAYLNDSKESFTDLLGYHADPNYKNGWRALLVDSILNDRDFYFESLISEADNLDLNLKVDGRPVVFYSLLDTRLKYLKELLDSGVNVNTTSDAGVTPLFRAATVNQFEVVYYLLKRDADPFWRDSSGRDIASRIYNYSFELDPRRTELLERINSLLREKHNIDLDGGVISDSVVRNFDEATGKIPPMWLKNSGGSSPAKLNPLWISQFPDEYQKWYNSPANFKRKE
ncbi:ankyrin repeat domain-containing protein [Synoicihabitans lomoniglobus]|uniref:Ankyrin repeat domain-containing protein n=1 Tax=Synoicihabitans lomoniglobus TaxID=2909285 RepID=A0AAE9ZWJ9_9BACT|nr:ankyrin repeat domain-containing protein [Opitutaceae bacterium LMO-M01]WED64409.1 ankyrin repeat domain-containing protein [Opitutaceae bacterium LMO-M01]